MGNKSLTKSPSIAFKVILLSMQDEVLSLTPSGKSRIIRVSKPVMLKVMKIYENAASHEDCCEGCLV